MSVISVGRDVTQDDNFKGASAITNVVTVAANLYKFAKELPELVASLKNLFSKAGKITAQVGDEAAAAAAAIPETPPIGAPAAQFSGFGNIISGISSVVDDILLAGIKATEVIAKVVVAGRVYIGAALAILGIAALVVLPLALRAGSILGGVQTLFSADNGASSGGDPANSKPQMQPSVVVETRNIRNPWPENEGPPIALGLDEGLKQFAKTVDGIKYDDDIQGKGWMAKGLLSADEAKAGLNSFKIKVLAVMNRTKQINFNLTGLEGITDPADPNLVEKLSIVLRKGKDGFFGGNYTNAEFYSIITNKNFSKKTQFFLNGQVVTISPEDLIKASP